MNVRKQIVAVLVSLAAPVAVFAASPASAGAAEAAARSGQLPSMSAPPAAPAGDRSARMHEMIVTGTGYQAGAKAAEETRNGDSAQPTRDDVSQGYGYALSSYAAVAPSRG